MVDAADIRSLLGGEWISRQPEAFQQALLGAVV